MSSTRSTMPPSWGRHIIQLTPTKPTYRLLALALILLSVVLLLFSVETAQAATFNVTKETDTNDGVCDADCSLREAIVAANANAEADVITVPAGTYTLTFGSQLPAITTEITIRGDDASNTIIQASTCNPVTLVDIVTSASPCTPVNYRVLQVDGGNLTVENVTIRHGRLASPSVGGGIFNANGGTLTVTNSTISGNTANTGSGGGIFNFSGGTLTVTNSTISGNSAGADGGGISNNGTLTVTNSTISGNTAVNVGGGIYNDFGGTINAISNSTISGNTAGGGGGIFNRNTITAISNTTISGNSAGVFGGGIRNDGTINAITNSTISGNTASNNGGGIDNFGSGTISAISNSTISGNTASNNGGGISNDGTINAITNSIILGNRAPSDPECRGISGADADVTNIAGDASCGNANTSTAVAVFATVSNGAGVLADNGGPTQTIALRRSADNPALDAVDCSNLQADLDGDTVLDDLDVDQRGEAREVDLSFVNNGGICDVGAFELSRDNREATDWDGPEEEETPTPVAITVTEPEPATADLTIDISAVPTVVSAAGDAVTFTVTLTNASAEAIDPGTLTVDIDSVFAIQSATVGTVNGQQVTLEPGTVGAGQTVTVSVIETTFSGVAGGAAAQTDSQFEATASVTGASDTVIVSLLPDTLPDTGGQPVGSVPAWALITGMLGLIGAGAAWKVNRRAA